MMICAPRFASSVQINVLSLLLTYALLLSLVAPFTVRRVDAAPARAGKAATSPASMPPPRKARHRDGELLIRFRQGASEQDKNTLVANKGARRDRKLQGKSRLEKLRLSAGRDPLALAAELRQNPLVELAEPNYLVERDEIVPDDPQFNEQWALRNTGQNNGQATADISASVAWETTTGAPSTVIAVIDSGIDFTHPDLQHNQWTNTAEQANGIDDDQNGLVDDLHGWDWVTASNQIIDEQGHGTAMAGLIAAEGNNATGTTGVMWRASLMSLRVLDRTGTGDVARAVEAIDYAVDKGATVINCSWGTDGQSVVLREAMERAAARQVLVVSSAGNAGRDIDGVPYYPASFDLPNLISVAATNNLDQLISTSNWGATRVTVAAPGASLLTTKMNGGYYSVTGTSASTAMVTGLVGLIRTVRPLLGAADTKAAIINGTRHVTDLAGKVSSGGLVSASGALEVMQGPDVEPSATPTPSPQVTPSHSASPTPQGGGDGGGGGGGPETGETDPPGEHGAPGGNLHDLEAERTDEAVEPQAPQLIHADLCTTCEGNDEPPPGQTPNDPDLSKARTEPQNETGQPSVDLGSRNYNWSMPIIGLPGRAGLDLGLTLYYNSLVWTRQGSIIRYNADRSHPGSGFRLGWPTIQQKYKNAQNKDAYLLVMPSGAHVEMESVGGIYYESMDSSHMQLTDYGAGGAVVRTTDGTKMGFLRTINVSGTNYPVPDGEMRCTQIMDRHGNFLVAEYDSSARLSKITDALGRAITLVYASYGKLLYINQQLLNGAVRRWATFTYTDITIKTKFEDSTVPYLSVEGPQYGTVINVPMQVQLIDGTRYIFDYTSWGQVWKIARWTPDDLPGTTNYELRSYTSYNLPLTDALPLDDCPRFTEQKVWTQNWNGDQDGVPNSEGGATTNEEALTKFSVASDDSVVEVILPDNTKYKEFFATTGWQKGLTTGTEVYVGTERKKWTTTSWTQDDEGLAYPKNPRVEEINLYDKELNRRRTTISYTTFPLPSGTSCSLPKYVREYDADATTVLRTTFYDYNMDPNYTGNSIRIIGLVSSETVYKGNITAARASKVTYEYDEPEGLVNEGENNGNGHDSNYGTTFKWRGNRTSVKRWDATVPSDTGKVLWTKITYNTSGSVVSTTDPLGHKTSISYADKYYNSSAPAAPANYNTWAYPTRVTDPDGYISTAEYDFDHGVREKTTTPSSGTSSGVTYLEMVMTYDGVGRMTRATNKNNNSYTRLVYDPSLMLVKSFQTIIATNKEAYSVQEFDGAGRVRGTATEHPDISGITPVETTTNQKNRFSGQFFEYDKMGRLWRRSNPTEMDRNWVDAGDDAAGGWRFTTQQYDWNGRPTITTNTDNSKRIVSYDGCGCAGGVVMTLTDERLRERKLTKDALGRLKQVEEMDFNGSPPAKTTYTYDVLDNLLTMTQGDNSATWRKRTLDYDGYGRLHSRTTPEQGVTIYSYNADDTIDEVATPSGWTKLSYTNNNRHLVTGITYTNKTGFIRPADATFSYDAAGNRTSMTDGQGRVDYHYNDLGQLTSEDRYFNALSSNPFTLSYLYNLGGELTKITNEKWNVNVGYGYDVIGRMNKVTGGGWAGVTSYVGSMEYRAFGALKTVNYTNNKSLGVTYDARLNVKQWNVEGVLGWLYSYQYFGEKSGRVTFADSLDDTTLDRSYEYDHVGRLVRSETGSDARSHINPTTAPPGTGDGPYSQSYTYDQWGNMKSKQGRGGADFVPYSGATYSIDNQRQGYTYDAAGNLTVASTWAYTYDVMGQQVEARQNGVLKLEQWYDGDGLRLKKNEEGEVTYYLRSSALGGQVVAEFNLDTLGQPQLKRGYVYMGGQMVALQDKNGSGAQQVTYVHQDPVTKSQRFTDSAGNLLPNKIDLDPWGLETGRTESPEQQPHRYTTYERDKNKSDEAMMRRYTGSRNRFDQPDPYDGSYALTNPQSFNRYAYVQNDPVNFTDPSGSLDSWNCSAKYSFEQCGGNGSFWGGGDFGDEVARWNSKYGGMSEHIAEAMSRFDDWVSYQRGGSDPREFGWSWDSRPQSPPHQQDPKQMKEVPTDCDVFVAEVARIARENPISGFFFANALRERFNKEGEEAASTEFASTGFKSRFRDDEPPGNTPNQVRHYVGGFRAALLGGRLGGAYATWRERGGTASNKADLRLNVVSRKHAFAIMNRVASHEDLSAMIRRDVCE